MLNLAITRDLKEGNQLELKFLTRPNEISNIISKKKYIIQLNSTVIKHEKNF